MHARNFTTNVPKILDLKSSSEQIFFRKLSLGAPDSIFVLNFNTRGHLTGAKTLYFFLTTCVLSLKTQQRLCF